MKATERKIVPRREGSHYAQNSHGQHDSPGCQGCWSCPKQHYRLSAVFQNHAKELTPKPQDCPATQDSSEPVPAMSHLPLAKVSLNTLCCSVLNELEAFRVQQFEPHPTKDMVKKTSLSPRSLMDTQVEK